MFNMNKIPVNFQSDFTDLLLPPILQNWLLYPGSFMQHLKKQGVYHPEIKVLNQDWFLPETDEKKELQLPTDEQILRREVLISSENTPLMFAYTIFPRDTLTD